METFAPMEMFADGDVLADAAADALAQALEGEGPRSLVVTGGRSPGPVYERLSYRDLGWGEVMVTLSDERWVDPGAPESNARLVYDRLLTGRAAAARFIPLKGAGATPEADASAVEPTLRRLLPWSAILLGMGEDGHVASLFPRDPDLAGRLDLAGERLCVGVATAGLPPFVPRLTLTVRALLASRLVLLLITGEAKQAIIQRIRSDPAYAPPAAAILRQDRTPVRILWAP